MMIHLNRDYEKTFTWLGITMDNVSYAAHFDTFEELFQTLTYKDEQYDELFDIYMVEKNGVKYESLTDEEGNFDWDTYLTFIEKTTLDEKDYYNLCEMYSNTKGLLWKIELLNPDGLFNWK